MWHCGAVDRKVRATDVAARAQVSRTAVSFVLNGRGDGNVAPEAQERIRAAARELGYQPDRVARSLRLGRTHVIGFVTDAIATSPFAGRRSLAMSSWRSTARVTPISSRPPSTS